MTREQLDREADRADREALRETRWLESRHNEWNLTPDDGRSLREYALEQDHAMAAFWDEWRRG